MLPSALRMRRLSLILAIVCRILCAQNSTTVALQSSPGPANLGSAVTLTANVTPTNSSGTVTFYDGVAILGVSQLSNGQATFTTRLLNAGIHTLRAYYGGKSATTSQTVNAAAAGGFQPAVTYPANASPQAVVTADFDGDGKTDLAVLNATGGVSILSGKGDGTFQTSTTYAASWIASGIAVGDFNNDGKPDLAVTSSGQVGILLGNGDGSFQAPVPYAAGVGANSIVVIDANSDGNADVAVLNQGEATVSILLGNGDATFRPQSTVPVTGLLNVQQAMIAADFNGDGFPDLAITFDAQVAILLGNGDGTFQPPANYPFRLVTTATSLAAADFNGDGKPDLVVGNFMTGVNILLGNGDGSFQNSTAEVSIADLISYFGGTLVVGDFDGDGKMDFAAADFGHTALDGVAVAFGNGDGTFRPPTFYRLGPNPTFGLVTGDFNGDGRTDLAATVPLGNSVAVILSQTAPPPVVSVLSVTPSSGVGRSQNFTFTFSDSAGANDIALVTAWLGQSTTPVPPLCSVTYNPQSNMLALRNDDGSLPVGAPPGAGSQQNSFCTLDGANSSVVASRNSLTLNLALNLSLSGNLAVKGEAVSMTGIATGWTQLGSWIADTPPQVVSVTPSGGTGLSQTFTFVYSDPASTTFSLFDVQAIFRTQNLTCQIQVAFAPLFFGGSGTFPQVSLDNSVGYFGDAQPLQNPQCSVDLANSSGVVSGNTYTLTLPVMFTSALAGVNTVGGSVSRGMFKTTVTQTLGTWNVPHPCNVTNDASPGIADVQRVLNEALGAATPSDDMNFDSVVNLVDAQIVANAALNLGCSWH
jgi:hypothetical protein